MQSVTPTPAAIVPASATRRGRVSKFLILRDAYIATNPRPVTEDDVRRICLAAY